MSSYEMVLEFPGWSAGAGEKEDREIQFHLNGKELIYFLQDKEFRGEYDTEQSRAITVDELQHLLFSKDPSVLASEDVLEQNRSLRNLVDTLEKVRDTLQAKVSVLESENKTLRSVIKIVENT